MVRRCLEGIVSAGTTLERADQSKALLPCGRSGARRDGRSGHDWTAAAGAARSRWPRSPAAPGGGSPIVPLDDAATVVRLSIPAVEAPFRSPFGTRNLAISADGSRVAYASESRLWIRRLNQKEVVAIDVTASNPFFSPDGDWVAFFGQTGETGLKKVSALGGAPVQIAATSQRPGGGTWRADGTIVFATNEGLYQVSGNGGEPRLLVKPDPRRKERQYAWPQFLPDGRSVLFTMIPENSIDGAQIAVLDLQTLEARVLLKGGSAARDAPRDVGYAPEKPQSRGLRPRDDRSAVSPCRFRISRSRPRPTTAPPSSPCQRRAPSSLSRPTCLANCERCRGSTVGERKNRWRSRLAGTNTLAFHRTAPAWPSTFPAPIGISGSGTSNGRA